MTYLVAGTIRLNAQTPGRGYEQVVVRQKVAARSSSEAFEVVKAEYRPRLAESDLTAEEIAK